MKILLLLIATLILNASASLQMKGSLFMVKMKINQLSLFLVLVLSVLIATSTFAADVQLAWDPNDPVPEGYRLFQRIEGGVYDYTQPVITDNSDASGNIPASITTTKVSGLQECTSYFFVVRAYVGAEESGDSNEVDFKAPVSAPQGLRIVTEIAVIVDSDGNVYIAQK